MAITAVNIIDSTLRLLGRPSQGDLQWQDVLDVVRDVYRGRLIDLKLANRNHTLAFSSYYTPLATEGVAIDLFGISANITNFIPVKVEWKSINADSTVKPRTATLVSYENLSRYYREAVTERDTYVAFYGNNKLAFSEKLTTLAERVYRIVYEDTEDVTMTAVTDTITNFPELFTTLLSYETALMCLDLVKNDTDAWAEKRERLRGALAPVFLEWNDRFRKWQTTLFGNKRIKKGGFPPRRRG